MAWPKFRPAPPVPAGIRAYYRPGKINVVEFSDYQCPFCRKLHGELKSIIADYPGKVHVVRLNKPLKSHRLALPAAKAAVCAEQQGKGDAMADALFKSTDLTPAGNREQARRLGLDLAKFDRCLAAPDTSARIQRESDLLSGDLLKGLPTTFVGARMIVGAQPQSAFREAFERAASGVDDEGISAPLYLVLALALGGGVLALGLRRSRP